MTLASQITRTPLAHDAQAGADIATRFAAQPPQVRELLSGTAGCSPYLRGLMLREADWLEQALVIPDARVMADLLAEVRDLGADQLKPGLRQAKRRAALYVALADLAGAWQLEQVTAALSDLADTCVDVSLKRLVAAEIRRAKLPGATEADIEDAGGMVALAMGKHGARELNYSSDIDLICLYDDSRFEAGDLHEARAVFVRVTRRMAALMSELTGDGYVFRTDLRLRPDPSVTPVCIAMEAAERYYESLGRTWERAAYIKARPCAGDLTAGRGFLERLRPFVWRKHLDFAAIEDAHNMRLRIRDHKGLHGALQLEGHNMKLGRGGIREIEFFTQTRQIIAGGRDADLRERATVPALARLAQKGWLPADLAQELGDHYRAHREIEHRLQMIDDAQTHSLPNSPEGFDRLARFTGYGETADLRTDLTRRLQAVAHRTEEFFAPPENARAADEAPALPEAYEAIISRWYGYPALRTARAEEIFERLRPELTRQLMAAGKPEEALYSFDGFLKGLPAGVQVFSMFQSNPQLLELMVDICAVSPELAQFLSRNAGVFDAVIGGDFFAPWPGMAALRDELGARLGALEDYEHQLDAARCWTKEWHFRTGVHLLRGLIDAGRAAEQYADLAEAVLAALWPCVVAQFAAKHGDPPGNGAVVMGMGSLGAGRLTAQSDLDLIVIYDPAGVDSSDGRRPLPTRTYYARLTQAMVTALSAPMAEGRLYEVDMRLRPSGNQGPVATSVEAFRMYQREQAWTWEHLALTRARVVTGAPGLAKVVETFRRLLLSEKGDLAQVMGGVLDMRARLAQAKPPQGVFDAKRGPGRAQQIELIAQAAALVAGSPATDLVAQLQAGVAHGVLRADEADTVVMSYDLFRRYLVGARLLSAHTLDAQALGAAGRAFLLRTTGSVDESALAQDMETGATRAAQVIEAVLSRAGVDMTEATDG